MRSSNPSPQPGLKCQIPPRGARGQSVPCGASRKVAEALIKQLLSLSQESASKPMLASLHMNEEARSKASVLAIQTSKTAASALAVGGSRFGHRQQDRGPGTDPAGSPGASRLAEAIPGEHGFSLTGLLKCKLAFALRQADSRLFRVSFSCSSPGVALDPRFASAQVWGFSCRAAAAVAAVRFPAPVPHLFQGRSGSRCFSPLLAVCVTDGQCSRRALLDVLLLAKEPHLQQVLKAHPPKCVKLVLKSTIRYHE